MFNAIICRYHEIAIKGRNRNMFEKRMVENLHSMLRELPPLSIRKIRGRIWISKKDDAQFSEAELDILKQRMHHAFGLESFSPVIMCEPDIEKLHAIVKETCKPFFEKQFEKKKIVSFRVRARRSDKKFPLRSKEVEINLARAAGNMYDHDSLDINLDEADVTIGCEIREEFAFIFYENYTAPGGLPVGSNAPVLALLSGGIDSPVACYMTMKRGSGVHYITFHSSPYTPRESVDKVIGIATALNQFQKPGTLHICNLAPMQKLIRDNCEGRIRTVLYRRMMFRIAERVARKNDLKALLTGEALGQVASQTVVNMGTINIATEMLVLRPLVGMDKNEVIKMARAIDTFDMSNVQVPDSCTVFAPKSPSTAVSPGLAKHEEERIPDWENVMEQIINDIEIVKP
jgi:tRNA uracil 4-sulfurtransferase